MSYDLEMTYLIVGINATQTRVFNRFLCRHRELIRHIVPVIINNYSPFLCIFNHP